MVPLLKDAEKTKFHTAPGFEASMAEFLADPAKVTLPDHPLVSALVAGWDNSYSAVNGFVAACASYALKSKGPVLECGSGLTTLILGGIAGQLGYEVWVLEHKPKWGRRLRAYLDHFGMNNIRLCRAPLRQYEDFDWYDPPLADMPRQFDLVVCDGPPGKTRGGRSGLSGIMGKRMGPGTLILLDDAHRRGEIHAAGLWTRQFKAGCKLVNADRAYYEIRLFEGNAGP